MIARILRWTTSLFILVCLIYAVGTQSAQAQVKDFNVPAQAATTGIPEFARQAGIQILVSEPLVRGKSVGAVTGSHSVQEGFAILLKGTGLVATSKDGATFTVAPVAPAANRSHAAQFVPQGPNDAEAKSTASTSEDRSGIPEILVTGSKILNTDIKRSEDDVQPYVVFSREMIEQSGASNLEDFFRQRLTASGSVATRSQTSTELGSTSSISLRGLGDNQTLILLDGRRMAGFSDGGTPEQPDINAIPLAAIERIEVLPTTASAIYGGSATGGVVNIILRRDYAGVEARLGYEGTFDGGGTQRRADLSAGFNLEGGKTNVLLSVSYASTNSLLIEDRSFNERGLQLLIANNPSGLFSGGPPLGATSNISSADGSSLTLKNGTTLNSPMTFVPRGYSGPSSDGGAALVSNAGNFNIGLADTAQNNGGLQGLLNAPTVKSAMGTVRRSFAPWIDAFLETSVSENQGYFSTSPAYSTFSLAGTDPGNPFNQAVNVTTPAFGADQVSRTTLESFRVAGGVIAKLPGDWRASADYTWNRTQASFALPGSIDYTSASSAVSAGTLNVFQDTNKYPVSFASYVLPQTRTEGSGVSTTLKDGALRFSGPLPSFLGNSPTASVLLERRDESIGDFTVTQYLSPSFIYENVAPSRSQSVDSVYAELTLPFGPIMREYSGAHLIELQIAGRLDHYKTIGANNVAYFNGVPTNDVVVATNEFTSTNPTVGFRFQPIADVMFRGSYATGFLPPEVNQLASGAPQAALLPSTDPLRGNSPVGTVDVTSGGNASLRPEKSKSWTAGVVMTPRFVSGLRASIDWTKIEKTNAITTLSPYSQDDLNALIAYAPGRITRGPVLPGDPYQVGPITAIDGTLLNIQSAALKAYDFSLGYDIDANALGHFGLVLKATRTISNEMQVTPVAPVIETIGVVGGGVTGNIKWRGVGTASWSRGGLNLAWTTSYYSSYFLNQQHEIDINQGSATIPSQMYHSLFAGYRFGSQTPWNLSFLQHTDLQLSINNIFNKLPPIDVTEPNYYSPFGDPRLATYALSIRKAFN